MGAPNDAASLRPSGLFVLRTPRLPFNEQSTRAELMARHGTYYELVVRQASPAAGYLVGTYAT